MEVSLPHIAISLGEPAGIGPDIVLQALGPGAGDLLPAAITVFGDPDVLRDRANSLGYEVSVVETGANGCGEPHGSERIHVYPVACASPVVAGTLDKENSEAVIRGIDMATDACLSGHCHAIATAPVHKAVINDGGIPFSGHTEWIAERSGAPLPVMMLANEQLRVCLATTHLPLSEVPAAITRPGLEQVLRIMHADIARLYAIDNPVIGVCGLNPHAGEGGYLGREEIEIITPILERLRGEGMRLTGPLPADTAFTRDQLEQLDVVLAMYHDQGLPVIKHQGFGEVVNITLGLPLIRTSVDHGTALDLAATGKASGTSMIAAINLAIRFANNRAAA